MQQANPTCFRLLIFWKKSKLPENINARNANTVTDQQWLASDINDATDYGTFCEKAKQDTKQLSGSNYVTFFFFYLSHQPFMACVGHMDGNDATILCPDRKLTPGYAGF
jgi:hypothetical protein